MWKWYIETEYGIVLVCNFNEMQWFPGNDSYDYQKVLLKWKGTTEMSILIEGMVIKQTIFEKQYLFMENQDCQINISDIYIYIYT